MPLFHYIFKANSAFLLIYTRKNNCLLFEINILKKSLLFVCKIIYKFMKEIVNILKIFLSCESYKKDFWTIGVLISSIV